MTAARIVLLVVLAGGALLALALTSLRLRGERPALVGALVALRVGALALLLAALIAPSWETQRTVSIPGSVAAIVDTSQSMSLPSGSEGRSRLEVALEAGQELQPRLTEGAKASLTWAAADDTAKPVDDPSALKANGAATDLRATVRDVAAEGNGPVLLLSDGADTAGTRGSELARLASTSGATIHTVAVGDPRPLKDVAVGFVRAPARVRAYSEFELAATVRQTGYAGQRPSVEILRDGRPEATLKAGAGSASQMKATLKAPKPGRYRYTVRVKAQPGELLAANNSKSVLVNVMPDKVGVVLIAGAPSVEYASIKRVLMADRDLTVRCFVRKTAPAGFWRDDETQGKASPGAMLSRPDVNAVLLLDVPPVALGGLAGDLARFVRQGGGAGILGEEALAGGGAYATGALAGVLPVQAARVGTVDEVFAPAPAGKAPLGEALEEARIPWATLPPWRGRMVTGAIKPGASVDLKAGGSPLLVSWQVGRGRALVLATGSTHRWTFAPDAGDPEKLAHRELWGTLVDWLTEVRDDRPVVAEFDQESYASGVPARLLVQVADANGQPVDGASVEASLSAGGETSRVRCAPTEGVPGRYEAAIATDKPGELAAAVTATRNGKRLGSDQAKADVAPAVAELLASRPNPALLSAIAEASGGRAVRADKANELAGIAALKATVVQRPSRRSPTREPWVLIALVALWALDWGLRRRWLLR